MAIKWTKILMLSPDFLPKEEIDKLAGAVCPTDERKAKALQWERHDDGRLEL